MLAGIKYCGGCRASYDRRAEAEKAIAASVGLQGAAYVNAVEGGRYDILLVVCGCKARCPDISRYHCKDAIYIDGPGTGVKL